MWVRFVSWVSVDNFRKAKNFHLWISLCSGNCGLTQFMNREFKEFRSRAVRGISNYFEILMTDKKI